MGIKLLKKSKFLFFVLLFSTGISKTIFATHVQGGNLTYTCLGGNQFQITLALYRDCAGVSAPTSVLINRKSLTCGINSNFILNRVAGTGIEVSPICPNQYTTCSGGTLPGVQEYLFSGIITLPPCSDWVLSFTISARNNAINTIVSPGSQNMYIEATLNNLAFPCNNSPTFTNRPVPFICAGQPYCFNNGAHDPDGDSLSYTLIAPRTTATTNVSYISPYSANQPLASTPAATFNPQTGDMCITPTLIQVTVFAMLVKEWRHGILVGSIERDIQVRTVTCNNNNPYVNGINNTGVYSKNTCAGVPLTFNIPSFDADSPQNVTLSWNAGISGAAFNIGSGTRPIGVFSWTPTLADVSSVPHCFTVTVKDNYCPFIGSQTFSFCITVGGFTAAASSINTVCTASNGSASVIVTGGVAPITYNWTPAGSSAHTAITSGLAAGSYTCTVTDAAGCSNTYPITVNTTPGGTAAISSFANVKCHGASNGTATVTMGGTVSPPFTYAWTPVSAGTSATAVNLGPGTYSVVVTDSHGCTTSVSQAITEPPALTATQTFTNVGCFGGSTGTATTTAAGGTGPYTYLWMPGAFNTASIGSLAVGTHTVTVTDAKGCIATGTANIQQPAALAITAVTIPANCGSTNGSATVTGTGGFSPYTWQWSNGQTGASAPALLPGTYTVTITDLNLCTASIPVTIAAIAGPVAVISSFSNASCFGGNNGNATVGVTGGAMPFTFLWSNGQTTPTAGNLAPGIYSVAATDATGCVASTSITISQPALLDVNAVSSNPLCFGNTNGTCAASTVGGTAPYNYIWTTPGSPTTSNVTGLGAGTYSVTATDAHGCVATASVILTNPATLSTAITKVNISCKGACDGTAATVVSNGTPPYTYLWSNPAAQTTPGATGLCPGNYTVTVADAHGCPSQGLAHITEPALLTNSISSTGNLACFGVCTGFAQITAAGGTAPYSYSWMPGAVTSATAANLCAGAYTCTVTDAKGCTSIADTVITQPAQLTAVVSGTNISCSGSCNGTGNISFSGGTGPYTAFWTPSMESIFNPADLCIGVNTGRVTDSKGCSVSGSVTLTQSYTPVVVTTSTTSSNCHQSNGGACAAVSGGLPPYTYIWNDLNVTQAPCASSIPAGTYSVDVTDANGCLVTTVANVNDISAPTVLITSHTDLLCYGLSNGTAVSSITGGVSPYTELWTPGAQTNANPTNLAAGVNTMTVTDGAGCISSASVNILSPSIINHAVSALTNVTCHGICDGSAIIAASGGTGSLSFAWSDPGLQTTATATGLCAGQCNVIITDAHGCTALDSATIISQPNSLAITSSTFVDVTCFGDTDGSITPVISGGTPYFIFAWTPSGGNNQSANALGAGTYTLTVSDQMGCSVNQHWTISEPPLLTATSSFTSSTCGLANGKALVTPSGGTAPYTYQWNDPALQTSAAATGLSAGTYSVLVTDFQNCTNVQNDTVTDKAGPVIDSVTSVPVLCFGGNTGTAAVTIVSGTGTAPFVYSWNPPAQPSSSVTGLAHGTYSVTVTDSNSCTATGVVIVNEPSQLLLFVSPNDTICYSDTAQVYAAASGGTPAYIYSWTGASGSGFTGSGPFMVTPVAATMYTASVTDNKGCSAGPLNMYVVIKPSISLIASDTTICAGTAASIHANASGGTGGPYTYSWDNSNTSQSQTVTPPAGLTTINYIVTVSDGCSKPAVDTSTVIINPGSTGQFHGTPKEGCEPLSTAFSATSNNGITYAWNFGDGHTGSENMTSNTYTTPGVFDVTLTITTAAGCKTIIDSIAYITIHPKPTANFETAPISSPSVSFNDLSTVIITNWSWNFGDLTSTLDTSSIKNPTYQYPGAGTNTITLFVMNQFGCIDSTAKSITIIDNFEFYAPSAFSPDGNDVNDIFLPKGIAYDASTFRMMIFDRWGNLIFYSDDNTKGWDGRANHGTQIAEIDVYVWKVELTDNQRIKHSYIGSVTLLK